MNKKIRLGWIGSGFVGQVAHLNCYSYFKNIEIVGLAELRPSLGNKICKKHSIKKYYKNHLDLMNNEKLDAIVAIVNRKHTALVAEDILRRGINLFTEKPMAATYKQALKLFNLAKKNKCSYVIGNMRLHDSGVKLGKKYYDNFIKKKSLGKLLYFRSYCYAGGDYCNVDGYTPTNEKRPNKYLLPNAPSWVKKNKKKEFEKFLNYFSHDINLINYFFNEEPSISNFELRKYAGNVTLNYKDFFGTFEFMYLHHQESWKEGLEIYFEKGFIKIYLPPAFLKNQPAKVEIYNENKSILKEIPESEWSWSFKNQAENFIKIIKNKKVNHLSAYNSLNDIKIIENIWKKLQ